MNTESDFKTLRYVDFTGYDNICENNPNIPNDYTIYKWLKENGKMEIYFYDPFDPWWLYYHCKMNNKWYVRQDVNSKNIEDLEVPFYELDNEPHFIHSNLVVVENGKTFLFWANDQEPSDVYDFEAICSYTSICKPTTPMYLLCSRDCDHDVDVLYLRDARTKEPLTMDRIIKQNRISIFDKSGTSYMRAYTIFTSNGKHYICYSERGHCYPYNGNIELEYQKEEIINGNIIKY